MNQTRDGCWLSPPTQASTAGKWLRGPQLWESEKSQFQSGKRLGPSRGGGVVAKTYTMRKIWPGTEVGV